MPDLKIDFIVSPTYSTLILEVRDNSTYTAEIPVVTSPTITITPPGFDAVSLPFTFNETNLFDSADLGITEIGISQDLPDGVYNLTYSVNNGGTLVSVNKSIMRTEKIQQKFDEAFLQLEMIECDGKIKKQSKSELTTIYFFIQGAIASANNCAIIESEELYNKADKLLDSFIKNDCGCSGNNYIITYF